MVKPVHPSKVYRDFFKKNIWFFFSQRTFFILFSWLLTLLKVNYINIRKIFYFFNEKFEII
jgi:hypothetical protein